MRISCVAAATTALVISLIILCPTPAMAEGPPAPFMTGAQWLGMYDSGEPGKEAAAAYVAGYVDGVQSAEATERKKRFCVPETVTELHLADQVAAYLRGKSVFGQMGAPFVIDGALKERYRC